ncbi:MAG: YidC/Oxa1 family insertase periplasmic-domain containing protein [Gemmatimonadetes bacterium]|nr:YidC/Oxa1 family insertase periplasmic-domain containing protein [Gemmatimonadota bacterium]
MELRFLLAIVLMIAVIVVTNFLFPPVAAPPPATVADSSVRAGADTVGVGVGAAAPRVEGVAPAGPAGEAPPPGEAAAPEVSRIAGAREPAAAGLAKAEPGGEEVAVATPLYRFVFDTRGAALVSAELLSFRSFQRPGPVQLVVDGARTILAQRILVGTDTIDLTGVVYEADPSGVTLQPGDSAAALRFTYAHPTAPFGLELSYGFRSDSYVVSVSGRVLGLDRGVLLTDLGPGPAYNEAREQDDAGLLAYVVNHRQSGVRSTPLRNVLGVELAEGPFYWAALKSKYFVIGIVAGESPETEAHLGGLIAHGRAQEGRADITVTQPLRPDGSFAYRLFLGPQDYAGMSAVGRDFEEVNPYGWRVFRPIIRPFVAIITAVLIYMHQTLTLSYGWVLILFGILLRVLLWPLNQKAMRAQMKNMAVQPLLKEIQDKYKNNPEKLQQEMLKLYKEHGFNPMAGCLPMLLPWPMLIALFFVFQNTIEFRGVGFLWIPDLSRADPTFILPIFMGLSMLVLQWIGMRGIQQTNPQMKMMMWLMPIFLTFIFLNLASGLNLYYATSNVASLPQQYLIAKERAKVQKPRGA